MATATEAPPETEPYPGGLPERLPAAGTGATLYRKIAEVIGAVGTIPNDKTAQVKDQAGKLLYSYTYTSESALIQEIRPRLAAARVAVFASTRNQRREGTLTMIDLEMTFACGDTGETFTITGTAAAADKGDKAVYKAITSGFRYMLWKTFLVPTEGDDVNQHDEPVRSAAELEADQAAADEEKADQAARGGYARAITALNARVLDGHVWAAELARLRWSPEKETGWPPIDTPKRKQLADDLAKVVEALTKLPEDFDPDVGTEDGRAQMQVAVRAAFKAATGLDVQGPDPFDPAIPF